MYSNPNLAGNILSQDEEYQRSQPNMSVMPAAPQNPVAIIAAEQKAQQSLGTPSKLPDPNAPTAVAQEIGDNHGDWAKALTSLGKGGTSQQAPSKVSLYDSGDLYSTPILRKVMGNL